MLKEISIANSEHYLKLLINKTQIRGICKMHSAIGIYGKYPQVEREAIKKWSIYWVMWFKHRKYLNASWSGIHIRLLLDYRMLDWYDRVWNILLVGTDMHKKRILSLGNWSITDEG